MAVTKMCFSSDFLLSPTTTFLMISMDYLSHLMMSCIINNCQCMFMIIYVSWLIITD
jgi:hypothetical protein